MHAHRYLVMCSCLGITVTAHQHSGWPCLAYEDLIQRHMCLIDIVILWSGGFVALIVLVVLVIQEHSCTYSHPAQGFFPLKIACSLMKE